MILHRLGLIHKNQRGFTLIELMVAIGITSLIIGGIVTTIFQVFNVSTLSNNHMLALRQVQNAGYWISHDAQMAQFTDAESVIIEEGDPDHPLWGLFDDFYNGQTQVLYLSWVGWERMEGTGGNKRQCIDTYNVYYTYDDNKLWRYEIITTKKYNNNGQLQENETEVITNTTFVADYIYLPLDGNSMYTVGDMFGGKLVVLNPEWIEMGRLFTVDQGTSFSAPKVANYAARLFNHFPDSSPNLIKALLIASARIPADRPPPLDGIALSDSYTESAKLLKVYGYGKPNLDSAISSTSSNVLLTVESKIKPNGICLYYLYLPEEFVETSGKRELSVVLVYNPPIRRNRKDYMGISMEYHLFKNSNIAEVVRGYKSIQKPVENAEESNGKVPKELTLLFSVELEVQSDLNNEDISESLRQRFKDNNISLSDNAFVSVKETDTEWLITDGDKTYTVRKQGDKLDIYELALKEIYLHPSVSIRKRGLHQKGTRIYTRRPSIDPTKPLVLAVISQNRWLKDEDYLQDYAIVVNIRQEANIDIYNQIRQRITERERARIRA